MTRGWGLRRIYVMPSGLFALADVLDRHDIGARIVHLGLMALHDLGFDLVRLMESEQPRVVGLSLHWHFQLHDVLEAVRVVKTAAPGCAVVLGGFTASAFHEELLAGHPLVDFVVRGDGEEPLLALCRLVCRGEGSVEAIPNLVWRGGEGEIHCNPVSFSLNAENTSAASHARLDLLSRPDLYLEKPLYFDDALGLERCFFYPFGAGCSVSCSFCGGGARAHHELFGRRGYFFFAQAKVLRDLGELASHDVRTLRASFDPDPGGDYSVRLFREIGKQGLSFRMVFECWDLPTPAFVEAFAETFTEDSCILLSPDCGSEAVRKRNKGFFFSNADLLETVELAASRSVDVVAYFSYGLPFETRDDLETTAKLIAEVQARGARCATDPMFLDPFSPLFSNPERFGVTLGMRTLADFVDAHRDAVRPPIGYRSESLSEAEILEGCRYLKEIAGEMPGDPQAEESPSEAPSCAVRLWKPGS